MKKLFLLPITLFLLVLSIFTVKYPIHAIAPIGNYLVFSGGFLKAFNSSNFSAPAFSFEAWINPASTSGKKIILSIGAASTGKKYEVSINGGALSVEYFFNNGAQAITTAGNIAAGQWSHIAVVISESTTKLFINGSQVFAPNISNNNLSTIGQIYILGDKYDTTNNVCFSISSAFPSNSYFNPSANTSRYLGLMDEVRISNTTRDVAGLWNSGAYNNSLTIDSSTVILWHLDEPRGQTRAYDSSTNQINGVLNGGCNESIHFFGVLPTPTPFQFSFQPIQWTRPVLPTLSFPFPPPNPSPTGSVNPPPSNPIPTTSSVRSFPRRSL